MYKNITFFMLLFMLSIMQAQHTITGKFTPSTEYQWVIAYRITSNSQQYVANTKLKDGAFSLTLPKDAKKGIYRLVYALPQEQYNFDIMVDLQEDIVLNFDSEKGLSFTKSTINQTFSNYLEQITNAQEKLNTFYKQNNNAIRTYRKIIKEIKQVQESFEEKTKGSIAHAFVKANRPFTPKKYYTAKGFLKESYLHYFDAIDFSDTYLKTSNYGIEKILHYIFTNIPEDSNSLERTESAIQNNIITLMGFLQNTDVKYQEYVLQNIWHQVAASELDATTNFITDRYLRKITLETKNGELNDAIELYARLSYNKVAPEITWQEDTTTKKLSELNTAEHYLLTFWSSTCSHCLQELPQLREKFTDTTKVQVIAVGLEQDQYGWKNEAAYYPDFIHVLALDKWQSPLAKTYGVHATPTYFILDKDKKIVAKPKDLEEVFSYFLVD